MSAISIQVTEDTASKALLELMQSITPASFAGKVGPALLKLTKEHLAALGPNKDGYKTTRFYEKFSRGVKWAPESGGVVVVIPPAEVNGRQVGLGLRVFGGTITPKTAEMLAIPISPVSYGHVTTDFQNLFLLKMTDGRAFLCQRGTQGGNRPRRTTGGKRGRPGRGSKPELQWLFVLKSSVTQDGDRDVLPSDNDLLEEAAKAFQKKI